jgi:uncharacterized membrane protein YhaH (DUF805 family)
MRVYFDVWKRIFFLKGNSTRAEFWSFNIVNIILIYLAYMGMFMFDEQIATILSLALTIFVIPYLITSFTVAVRRLHDIGKSGWYYLIVVGACILMIIPIIGWIAGLGLLIWYLVMMCQDSQIGDNQYGVDPKAAERGNMAV